MRRPNSTRPSAEHRVGVLAGSAARFAGGTLFALFSLVTGAAVARRLGPDGKGVVATLSFFISLSATAAGLGLGEAGVELTRRRGVDFRRAVGATAAVLAGSTIVAALLAAGAGALVVGVVPHEVGRSLLGVALAVPLCATVQVGCLLLESRSAFALASAARVAVGAATLVLTLALIQDHWTTGAVAGMAGGWGVGAIVVVVGLAREHALPLPVIDGRYVREAVRFGLPVDAAAVVLVLSTRVDVVFLQAIRNATDVGFYSVGITITALVLFAPSALSAATYPRLASVDPGESAAYLARTVRLAIAAAIVVAAGLAIASPVVIPVAFGHGFRPAIPPTLGLLPGAVCYSAQYVLARARAAQGSTGVLLRSFALSTTVMVAFDLALIPGLGTTGAVLASDTSSIVGALVAARAVRRAHDDDISLLPRWNDVTTLLSAPLALLRSR